MSQKNAEPLESPESTETKEGTLNSEVTYKEDVEEATEESIGEESVEASTENDELEPAEEERIEYVEKSKYEEVQSKADENYQKFLRAQADLDNFRRRTRTEREEAAKYASLGLIDQLLPVVDNFERALASSQTNQDFDSLAKGIDMVFRQMSQTLEQQGLKSIEVVGKPFNPEFHQAIMQVESDEFEEGMVVEEVQKGYFLKDKVLRPAMVKVSK